MVQQRRARAERSPRSLRQADVVPAPQARQSRRNDWSARLLIDAAGELRRRPPSARLSIEQLHQRTARRVRRRASIGAAAVVAVGVGGIATVATRAGDGPSSTGAPPVSGVTASLGTVVVADVGWPPRLLVDGGWEITYYDQNAPGEDGTVGGDLTFESTAERAGTSPAAPQIQVMWSSDDRADVWSTLPTSTSIAGASGEPAGWEPVTVAGHDAVAFKTEGPIWVVIVAVPEGSIELRIPAIGRDERDRILDAIRPVDQATFDAALPESVIAPSERAAVVAELLEGVPVPADFDADAAVGEATVSTDRTALATSLASEVACAWLDDWFTVWETGDASDLPTILAALESAPSWPMLDGITAEQSGLPTVLADLVGTLRDGGAVPTGAGPAPITRDAVADMLGCD